MIRNCKESYPWTVLLEETVMDLLSLLDWSKSSHNNRDSDGNFQKYILSRSLSSI